MGARGLLSRFGQRGAIVSRARFHSHEPKLTAFGPEDQLARLD
jgi:hypothetical protein